MRNLIVGVAISTLLAVGLTACSSTDPLAEQFGDRTESGYVSQSGSISEFPLGSRGEPVTFVDLTTDLGTMVSSDDFVGEVLVVNFWYAACPPCRVEAPDLARLSAQFDGKGASFLGINIYDGPESSMAFARTFDIPYPSIIDRDSGLARLAFAGHAPPSAVPTTLVLDKEGRVAARFLGLIEAPTALDTIIRELIDEEL